MSSPSLGPELSDGILVSALTGSSHGHAKKVFTLWGLEPLNRGLEFSMASLQGQRIPPAGLRKSSRAAGASRLVSGQAEGPESASQLLR